ncbi:MAG: hypothetical protein HY301_04915 [Verrucomicrobia bacterium]|nr:hypothetical protein [Verrucomicrobiota bacterium]
MKTLFLILRVTTGMLAVGALGILLAAILLRSGGAFLKESVGLAGYVAKLFTSGFTEGTRPKEPAGWIVAAPQAGLALLFVAMLVSVFLPGTRWLLHLTAAVAAMAVIWYVRMVLTEVRLEILCVPLLVALFIYYAVCLFWNGNQPVPPVLGT